MGNTWDFHISISFSMSKIEVKAELQCARIETHNHMLFKIEVALCILNPNEYPALRRTNRHFSHLDLFIELIILESRKTVDV